MADETAREIADLRVEIGKQGEQIKTLHNRVNEQKELIKTVNDLAVSVGELVTTQKNITESIKNMRCDVDELRQKPGKRWDAVIAAAISGIVMYIIGRITKGA